MGNLTLFVVWAGSAFVGGLLIYFKQGRFLTDQQPIAFMICGPITLLIGLFSPKSWLTSKAKSEGRNG
jgi:hypothetical protein